MSLRYISSAILLLLAIGVDTRAHANFLFVASTGNHLSSCTQTAPCASLAEAITFAIPNDTIVCVDAIGDSGAILIDKSIEIECSGNRAAMGGGLTFGASISINIPVSVNDPFRTVRLRGLTIDGGLAVGPVKPRGIDIVSAAVVSIEDVVVSNMTLQGIIDRRTGGQTKLFITDSIIRNNSGPGIVAAAAAPGAVVLDNVRSENNAYGIAVAAGNSVVVNRSVISGNSVAGVIGDGGAQVVVNNSTISHNNIGVYSSQSVRLSNNDIAFNSTAITGSSGTFGNNRFSGNGTMGTPPAGLGGASSDLGQQ